jgi:hypothetical protein
VKPGSRGRHIAVWTLIVLGGVIVLVGSLTLWARRQLLDTDTWVKSSNKMLQDDEVRQAVSTYAVEQLFANVDVEAALQARLGDRGDALAAPASAALYEAALRTTDAVLQTPQAQQVWEELNRRAHARLVDVLEGNEGGRITTANGEVVLDLSPLIDRVSSRLGADAQIPPDAGQIVIMQSDQLSAAQDAVRILKATSALIGLLAIALFGLAVFLAGGWRRRAIAGASLAVIVAAVLVLVARRIVGNAVIDALVSNSSIRPPASRVWFIETDILREVAIGLLVLGLLFLLGAMAAGPSRVAVATRRVLVGPFRHPGWVYAVYAAIVVLLLLIAPVANPSRALGLLLLAVLGGFGVAAIRRQTLDEFGDAPAMQLRGPRRSSGEDARLDQLERLRALHDSGALTDSEYQQQKGAILGA